MFDSEKLLIIRPGRVTWLLAIITIILTAASTASVVTKYIGGHDKVFGLVHLFNMDYENNIPTFISTANLLVAALLLGIIAVLKSHKKDPFALHWKIMSLLLFVLRWTKNLVFMNC